MNRCNLQGSRASRGLASDPYTNLVIAIPHAVGKPFDVDWNGDTAAAVFRDRFTDWETDNLFSVSMEGVSIVSCPMSRLDVDVERLEEEGDRICNYEHVADSPQALSPAHWNRCLAEWFKYRTDLMLEEVAKAEEIKVEAKDLDAEVAAMAAAYGATPQQVQKIIKEQGRIGDLAASVLRKKTAQFIIDSIAE